MRGIQPKKQIRIFKMYIPWHKNKPHTIIIYFMIMILEKNEKNCFIFMFFFFK